MTTTEHEQLINDHWFGYSRPLLEAVGASTETLDVAEFLYRAAWLHGVRHEQERPS